MGLRSPSRTRSYGRSSRIAASRTEQVLRRLRRGPATIAELVPEMYADVSKGLWRPAAASTYAHLLMLVDEGRVASDGPAKRTSIYHLVA